jgi:hypothetical protein
MLPPFDLTVPTDARYRPLAPEVAGKFAELAGCAPAAASEVRSQVDAAADTLMPAGQEITLGCSTTDQEVVFQMRCGDQTATIRQTL